MNGVKSSVSEIDESGGKLNSGAAAGASVASEGLSTATFADSPATADAAPVLVDAAAACRFKRDHRDRDKPSAAGASF